MLKKTNTFKKTISSQNNNYFQKKINNDIIDNHNN